MLNYYVITDKGRALLSELEGKEHEESYPEFGNHHDTGGNPRIHAEC